jgi:hypothetical protein
MGGDDMSADPQDDEVEPYVEHLDAETVRALMDVVDGPARPEQDYGVGLVDEA